MRREEARALVHKRHVEDHPGPGVPSTLALLHEPHGEDDWHIHAQVYACERPEDDATDRVLWHTGCAACVAALQAAVANDPGLILMTHGATYRGQPLPPALAT